MNLSVIHHVAIIVSNYKESRNFYVNQLGFEVIRENYRPERQDWKLDLKCGDIELEIFGVLNPPQRVNYPEACGLRHLAFKVENIENTSFLRIIVDTGVEKRQIISNIGKKRLYGRLGPFSKL